MEVALNNVDKMKHGLALETLNMDFNPHCCWDLRSCKDITLPKIFPYRIWFSCFESTKLKFMVNKKKKIQLTKIYVWNTTFFLVRLFTYILKDLLLWNLIPVLRLTKLKFKGGKIKLLNMKNPFFFLLQKRFFYNINFIDFV